VEKNMMMTKVLQFVEDSNKKMMTYKVNALAIIKKNYREFATIKVSGRPIKQDCPHTLKDTKKTLLEGCEMLQGTLHQQYLDVFLETAKKLKFYTMQVIGMFQ
jgi:hypothetical protein